MILTLLEVFLKLDNKIDEVIIIVFFRNQLGTTLDYYEVNVVYRRIDIEDLWRD